ncbi:MAG: hypothetical protein JSV88_32875 [Candidatus Aminicenantes bacterium]|nr:MAG: hypothetical protein JSV88_32875 [Candidatus Aminicenantes bacterium]
MLTRKIIKEIKFELEEIENLFELYKKMKSLVTPIQNTWERFKVEISSFLKALESEEEES